MPYASYFLLPAFALRRTLFCLVLPYALCLLLPYALCLMPYASYFLLPAFALRRTLFEDAPARSQEMQTRLLGTYTASIEP